MRLIDADALMIDVREWFWSSWQVHPTMGLDDIERLIYDSKPIPQKEYTEQQIRDTFNSGFSCGMEREWIDTEEEMPIDGEEVLASVYWKEYGDTILAYGHYSPRIDKWKLYSDSEGELLKGYEVTAWMPVPYPYTAYRKTEQTETKWLQREGEF